MVTNAAELEALAGHAVAQGVQALHTALPAAGSPIGQAPATSPSSGTWCPQLRVRPNPSLLLLQLSALPLVASMPCWQVGGQ